MDKAIEKIKWLQDVFVIRKEEQHFDVDVTIKDAFTEALSELQDYKAKIDSLKEWAKNQQGGKIAFWSDVLEKIEELDK